MKVMKLCAFLVILCLAIQAKASKAVSMFSAENTIQNILDAPEFSGYAAKILPWDDLERNDSNLKVSEVSKLMPWHSEIKTNDVLKGLNYLLSNKTFYNIYPDNDIKQKHTGLFFFKGQKNAPFAIICPGGGFAYIGSLHEGFPIAYDLSQRGYNAFVLKYRGGSTNAALEDLAQALTYIFNHQKELNVSFENYSVWGGSAGARMAAYIGTYGAKAFGGADLAKPAMIVVNYTGYSDYTPNTSPIFMAVGENDGIANPNGMKKQAERLKQMGVETDFNLYPKVGHGFGLGTGTSAQNWVDKAITFWEKHIK